MLNIKEIEGGLMKKEAVLDELIKKNREIVRLTANSIKEMHAGELGAARKLLSQAESEISTLSKQAEKHGMDLNHIMQEYAEAKILLAAIERKDLPSSTDLGATPEAYLNGLLDATGELKRQMYECLRKGKKKDAEYYFGLMEKIYDELLPLKFSNALLPDFRRKQDVARMQIEQARGELL
jgi:translin